ANIQSGFGQVVIGGNDTSLKVHIGQAGNSGSVVVSNNLLIQNPNLGGEVYVNQDLRVSGSLVVHGSGHTTHLINQNTSASGNVFLDDSVVVSGTATLEAGTSGTGGIQLGNSASHSLNGDGQGDADNLTLLAAGNVVITGNVGDTDALGNLTIDAVSVNGVPNLPDNVTFNGTVVLRGDLIVRTSGTVTFANAVTVGGQVIVVGGGSVVFTLGLQAGGDITLQGNEIDFVNGATGSIKTTGADKTLWLKASTASQNIEVGSPMLSDTSTPTLYLTAAETGRIAGSSFAKVVIGNYASVGGVNHAVAGSGTVTLDASSLLRANLEVYGQTIVATDSQTAPGAFISGGTLKLDATGDIRLYNQVDVRTGNGVLKDAVFYAGGAIAQYNDTSDLSGDDKFGEPLRAASLTATAVTGINLFATQLASVSAVNTGASGDIAITENAAGGALDVLRVAQTNAGNSGGISVTTTAGDLTVLGSGSGIASLGGSIALAAGAVNGVGGNLSVNQAISSANGGISLSATGALSLQSAITTTAGAVSLTAGGAINLGGSITGGTGAIAVTSTGTAADAITMSGSATLSGTGPIGLTGNGNLVVNHIEGNGAASIVSLTAGGSIAGVAGATHVTGESAVLRLSAVSGIGGTGVTLHTQVGSLTAANTGSTGGIYVQEATALSLVTNSGSNAIANAGSGAVVIRTTTGDLTLASGANVAATSTTPMAGAGTGNILLQAQSGALNLGGNVNTASGHISLLASGALALTGNATVQTQAAGKTVDISAGANVAMAATTRVITAGGNVQIAAATGVALASVSTGSSSAGTVSVATTAGAIVDADADNASPPLLNVTAGALRLQATGAGATVGSATNALETAVTTLAVSTAAGLYISEENGLVIGSVTGAAAQVNRVSESGAAALLAAGADLSGLATSANGSIVVNNGTSRAGDLVVDAAIRANGSGHVLLANNWTGVPAAGGITLNAGVSTDSGSISLIAAGSLVQATGVTVATAGSGTLDVQAGGSVTMGANSVLRTAGGNVRVAAGSAGSITVGQIDAGFGANVVGQSNWGQVALTAGASILDDAGENSIVDVYASA
ncbi:beta strand repeat-containing protein, partial [Pseudacidovorax intermedius]